MAGFEATILMQAVRKYLVYGYVPVMVNAISRDTNEICRAQRSIYIMLRGNEEARLFIDQVRNVLWHLTDKYMIVF